MNDLKVKEDSRITNLILVCALAAGLGVLGWMVESVRVALLGHW